MENGAGRIGWRRFDKISRQAPEYPVRRLRKARKLTVNGDNLTVTFGCLFPPKTIA